MVRLLVVLGWVITLSGCGINNSEFHRSDVQASASSDVVKLSDEDAEQCWSLIEKGYTQHIKDALARNSDLEIVTKIQYLTSIGGGSSKAIDEGLAVITDGLKKSMAEMSKHTSEITQFNTEMFKKYGLSSSQYKLDHFRARFIRQKSNQ